MRGLTMIGTVAAGMLAAAAMVSPALARPAADLALAAPLVPNMPSTAMPQVRGPLLQPLASGGRVERSARITGNLHLRVAMAATAQGPRDRIQQRIASSMLDFYPLGASGFHLSAGTRMYDPRVGEQATNRGLMTISRQTNVPGGRLGMRRTPAFTMGYAGEVAERTSLGLEVGAMMGHAYSTSAADTTRRLRGERPGGNPVNPMVNLVVGRRF